MNELELVPSSASGSRTRGGTFSSTGVQLAVFLLAATKIPFALLFKITHSSFLMWRPFAPIPPQKAVQILIQFVLQEFSTFYWFLSRSAG